MYMLLSLLIGVALDAVLDSLLATLLLSLIGGSLMLLLVLLSIYSRKEEHRVRAQQALRALASHRRQPTIRKPRVLRNNTVRQRRRIRFGMRRSAK
ncbi:hypothetical protein GCM10010250_67570 [Streptomyces althioticus]|nr:hypothetical protein GCM10010250_67570 [Streptomyces althioticus]